MTTEVELKELSSIHRYLTSPFQDKVKRFSTNSAFFRLRSYLRDYVHSIAEILPKNIIIVNMKTSTIEE
jgi:hypothetical protein